jgi:opacity protein-like surface antigen
MRRASLCGVALLCLLTSAVPAWAERNWEFSFGGYGGKAYHMSAILRPNWVVDTNTGIPEPSDDAKGRFIADDSNAFGAKVTAWFLPRKRSWSPQLGFELDWTRFTSDIQAQTGPAEGNYASGQPIGSLRLPTGRDLTLNNLAINLLFRYPIWATPDMPQGRWHPYGGIGGGVSRARLALQQTTHTETSYGPSFQVLAGAKFFLVKNLALFAEWKWTRAWHSFEYEALGPPPGYQEGYTLSTNLVVGGVALHF